MFFIGPEAVMALMLWITGGPSPCPVDHDVRFLTGPPPTYYVEGYECIPPVIEVTEEEVKEVVKNHRRRVSR